MNTLPSSFHFPITIVKMICCDQNNVSRTRGREMPIFKKMGLLWAERMQLLWTTHQNCMITFLCIKFLMQGGVNRFNFQKLLSKNFNFLGCKLSFCLRPKVAIKPNRLEQKIFWSVSEKRGRWAAGLEPRSTGFVVWCSTTHVSSQRSDAMKNDFQ